MKYEELLSDFPEINLKNYNEDDVFYLNRWAIEAYKNLRLLSISHAHDIKWPEEQEMYQGLERSPEEMASANNMLRKCKSAVESAGIVEFPHDWEQQFDHTFPELVKPMRDKNDNLTGDYRQDEQIAVKEFIQSLLTSGGTKGER